MTRTLTRAPARTVTRAVSPATMSKIRILIVDDAVVFRRLLADLLSADPELEVAGTAANGRIALAKMPQVNPDLVILDIEMPEMDGLQTLEGLRKDYPTLPVIMFSALTQRGAAATLDALARGATDYFTKPATGGREESLALLRETLVPEIKALCAEPPSDSAVSRRPALPRPAPPRRNGPVEVVAIGASTGGPNALGAMLPELPADFPVPIVIVQHMPPLFTQQFADRLDAKSAIRVDEGAAGAALTARKAWVAPGGDHMTVVRSGGAARLAINHEPPENSCRPSVDVLFRSVAAAFGAGTLAVIMTGMGQDGLRGCEAIREAGGQVLAQDEASSVVWGMPGAVARAGLADEVLPADQLAAAVRRRVRAGRD